MDRLQNFVKAKELKYKVWEDKEKKTEYDRLVSFINTTITGIPTNIYVVEISGEKEVFVISNGYLIQHCTKERSVGHSYMHAYGIVKANAHCKDSGVLLVFTNGTELIVLW